MAKPEDIFDPDYDPSWTDTDYDIESEVQAENTANADVIEPEPVTQNSVYLTVRTGNSGLTTSHVRHHALIPEYPESHLEGICHVISVQGKPRSYVEALHTDIQYGKRRGNHRDVHCNYLDGAKVALTRYTCSGVKICPFLRSEIRDLPPHTKIPDNWTDLLRTSHRPVLVDLALRYRQSTLLQKATEGLYIASQKLYYEYKPCTPYGRCGGKPILRAEDDATTNITKYHIGCTNYRSTDTLRHHWSSIKPTCTFDPTYLVYLFLKGEIQRVEYCTTIEKMKAERKECVELHINGRGKYKKLLCQAEFVYIVPHDLQKYPYVLLYTQGVHTHLPPPPTKTPLEIRQQIEGVMRQGDVLGLTRASFLQSDRLQEYLRQNESVFVTNIHPSLNNYDLWNAWIRKVRLLEYPQGTDFAAVVFEYMSQNKFSEDDSSIYIRNIYNDNSEQIVLCFSKKQADQFAYLQYFQVDMTFKRIYGSITEIVLGWYDTEASKSIALARIYVNKDGTNIYKRAFIMLFQALPQATRRPITWKHIHCDPNGLFAVVADMDGKQAHGFGEYLQSLDDTRTWQEHLQYTYVYCLIHYERNIRVFEQDPLYFELKAIPYKTSRHEVQQVFDQIQASSNKKLRDWGRHYNAQLYLCGLNQHYSKMDPELFNAIQRHTNTLECIHKKTNQMGIHSTFLGAIRSAQHVDNREIDAVEHMFATGVKHSWTNKSPSKRIGNAVLRRDAKRYSRLKARGTRIQSSPSLQLGSNQSPIDLDSDDSDDAQLPLTPFVLTSRPSVNFASSQTPTSSNKRGRSSTVSNDSNKRQASRSKSTHLHLLQDQLISKEEISLDRQSRQLQLDQKQLEIDCQRFELDVKKAQFTAQGAVAKPKDSATYSSPTDTDIPHLNSSQEVAAQLNRET